jgi:hypothetical protein
MLEKVVKKLWQGRFVSVRDYEVEAAILRNGMIIHYEGESMFLSLEKLKEIMQNLPFTNPPIKSKTGGKNYRLVDIPWKPAAINTDQKEMFNV